MIEDKIFGWDLDHTLGNFYPIATNRRGPNVAYDEELSLKCLKKGITEFLEKLCSHNCRNFIMTQGSTAYTQEVLTLTGIDKYFEGIFDGEQINAYRGKLIKPLTGKMGLTDEEAKERMLVIGDTNDDQPADINGVVFIFHPGGYRYDAEILDTVPSLLNNLGEGSFNRGFSRLYERADSRQDLQPKTRFYNLNDSVRLFLEQQTTDYLPSIKNAATTVTVPTLKIL